MREIPQEFILQDEIREICAEMLLENTVGRFSNNNSEYDTCSKDTLAGNFSFKGEYYTVAFDDVF